MKRISGWWVPGVILLLAFVQGSVYVFLMPPWQHYDEPSHFEHIWVRASTGHAPQPDTPDLAFRRKLVQSMVAHDFYTEGTIPDLARVETGETIWGLEYTQLDEPPLYYMLASLPVRFLLAHNPAQMLIAARMMSVGLFVFTILSLWGITREVTAPGSPLRVWVPLSAALLPGFVDLMTAVNNDVGAIAAFSFFLWGGVVFLRKPGHLGALGWVIGSTLLCLGMKSTAFLAVPLSVFVLMLGWMRGRVGQWLWWMVGLAGLVGVIALLTWEDAAYWARATSQLVPTRIQTESAPVGNFALQVTAAPTTPTFLRPLQQRLPLPVENMPYTFGVWMWASGTATPLEIRTPALHTGPDTFFETVSVGTTPAFYAFEVTFPFETTRLWVALARQNTDAVVYYDGFVLAQGQFPHDTPPVFDDASGVSGTWGGQRFQNLIRNPSAEQVWPAVKPAIDNWLSKIIPDNARLSTLWFGVLDWPYTAPYFVFTVNHLLDTFWARFGWGHVPLVVSSSYGIFRGLSLVGLLGCGLRWQRLRDKKVVWMGISAGLIWGATLFRGEIFLFTASIFIPGARYAYPAIAPTLLAFWAGWQAWGSLMHRLLKPYPVDLRRTITIIMALFFLSLNLVSIYSILRYYQ